MNASESQAKIKDTQIYAFFLLFVPALPSPLPLPLATVCLVSLCAFSHRALLNYRIKNESFKNKNTISLSLSYFLLLLSLLLLQTTLQVYTPFSIPSHTVYIPSLLPFQSHLLPPIATPNSQIVTFRLKSTTSSSLLSFPPSPSSFPASRFKYPSAIGAHTLVRSKSTPNPTLIPLRICTVRRT